MMLATTLTIMMTVVMMMAMTMMVVMVVRTEFLCDADDDYGDADD